MKNAVFLPNYLKFRFIYIPYVYSAVLGSHFIVILNIENFPFDKLFRPFHETPIKTKYVLEYINLPVCPLC